MTNYNDYIELIQKRRSMRAFTNQEVSDEDIRKIVDAARYAPSGMNFQPWEYIVVRDKKVISELVTMNIDDIKLPAIAKKLMAKKSGKPVPKTFSVAKNAPVLIVAIGDMRKSITLPGQMYSYKNNKIKLGKKLPIVDIDGLWYSSMANSFMQMITAATTLGLASQYCTFVSFKMKQKKVKELLEIPEYMKIYDAAAIGYPAYTPRNKHTRPLDDIIHFGTYDITKSPSDEYIYNRAQTREDMKYVNEDESDQEY